MDIRKWNQIFRALANVNRLKIITLLSRGRRLSVSAITREIGISFPATSRHLILLENLDVLENEGKEGHVFYGLNRKMSANARNAIRLFTSASPR